MELILKNYHIKIIIFIILLIPFSGMSQVKINVDSYLNLREEPNTNCRVIGRLVDSSVVTYAGEWRDGFIKVKQYFPPENDERLGDTKEGWVSSAYVSVPLLTSDILEPFEYIDSLWYDAIFSSEGMISQAGFIKINGKMIRLESDYLTGRIRISNNNIEINYYSSDTFYGYEGSRSEGILHIRYGGKEEFIYVRQEEGH
tara:strand:- start:589 stop:1188 length:600 start_codon:yes stop_codon:yes gene_type:complete